MKKYFALIFFLIISAILLFSRFQIDKTSATRYIAKPNSKELLLNKWFQIIESQKLAPEQFFNDPSISNLTQQIVAEGPNMVPVLVEGFRKARNRKEIYCYRTLFTVTGGMILRLSGNTGVLVPGYEGSRDSFLMEWDSGLFMEPEREFNHPAALYKDYRHFGVFSLPYLLKQFPTKEKDTLLLFLEFARDKELHRKIKDSNENLPGPDKQIEIIRDWWAGNRHKFNELHPLYERIDAAIKALPDLAMETNAVAAAASR